MANWNWARGKNEPYNRHGIDNVQTTGGEGTLVSVVPDGDGGFEIVDADAASGNLAAGMLIGDVTDLSSFSDELDGLARELAATDNNRTTLGDRVPIYQYGVEIVNDDADTDFTPFQPVYLAEGGGYTQTKPSTSGSVVQVVGRALGKDKDGNDRVDLFVLPVEQETVA